MKIHELKTCRDEFRAVKRGDKKFEFRRDDRGFEPDDVLYLREWINGASEPYFSGYSVLAKVTWIVRGPAFGVPDGFCVMSINVLREST